MQIVSTNKERNGESGNVLFLILIAVALFAALSYAVTQSSRSGGGDAGRETNLINSAQLTQYPAGIRTAIVRMIVGGVDATTLSFNPPSDFDNLTNGGSDPNVEASGVFFPDGGGATYTQAPSEVMAGESLGTWVFNAENEINLVGTTDSGASPTAATADIVAFLPGVALAVCNRINEQLGIAGASPPVETGIDISTDMVAASGVPEGIGAGGGRIGDDVAALDGQPFGCFQQGANNYVYYHVLIER